MYFYAKELKIKEKNKKKCVKVMCKTINYINWIVNQSCFVV